MATTKQFITGLNTDWTLTLNFTLWGLEEEREISFFHVEMLPRIYYECPQENQAN